MRYVREPAVCIDAAAIKDRIRTALTERTVDAYLDSVADIYQLLADVNEIFRRERVTRFEFADLLAATRTAFANESADTADDKTSELRALLYLHREITAEDLDAWRVTEQSEPTERRR
jgi:hypothetical protein